MFYLFSFLRCVSVNKNHGFLIELVFNIFVLNLLFSVFPVSSSIVFQILIPTVYQNGISNTILVGVLSQKCFQKGFAYHTIVFVQIMFSKNDNFILFKTLKTQISQNVHRQLFRKRIQETKFNKHTLLLRVLFEFMFRATFKQTDEENILLLILLFSSFLCFNCFPHFDFQFHL